ncbi:hypothetical protein JV197_11790, partial [Vibrio furnissii]
SLFGYIFLHSYNYLSIFWYYSVTFSTNGLKKLPFLDEETPKATTLVLGQIMKRRKGNSWH